MKDRSEEALKDIQGKVEHVLSAFKEEIKEEFRHQLGIQAENFQHKLSLVLEGQQMLSEKLDRAKIELDQKIECVEHKLDAVAADLLAHRRDTEAHLSVYKIKEGETKGC